MSRKGRFLILSKYMYLCPRGPSSLYVNPVLISYYAMTSHVAIQLLSVAAFSQEVYEGHSEMC